MGGLILSPVAVALGGGTAVLVLLASVLAALLAVALAVRRYADSSPRLL
jgi:hypothetical protein